MGWLVAVLSVVFIIVSIAMILVILIQRPQGGGLAGAFGSGGGSTQSAFGAKTGDVLTIVTVSTFVLFLAVAIGLVKANQALYGRGSPSVGPNAPVGLATQTLSDTQIKLTWTDTDGEDAYEIERSPDAITGWSTVAQLGPDTVQYTDTGLTPLTTYYYRIVALNVDGRGVSSAKAVRTDLSDLPVPLPDDPEGAVGQEEEQEPQTAGEGDDRAGDGEPSEGESESGDNGRNKTPSSDGKQ